MSKILKILLAAFVFRLILAFFFWHPDVNNHVDWGIRFWQYGPGEFYSQNVWSYTWPNQPPGTMYLFAGIRKLFEVVFSFFWFLNIKIPVFPSNVMFFLETNLYPALLKLPAILADLGIAWVIYNILREKKESLGILGAALFLINPAVWYNSAVWGQTDAVINFFAILAFYLLIKRKLTLSFLALALSFYFKASLLIFLPIFLIVVLKQKYKVQELFRAVFLPALVIGLLTLPFSFGEPYGWLYEIYAKKVFVQQLHVITANAFNIWAGIAGIHEQPNTLLLGPLSYQAWGLLLFGLSLIPALWLVFKKQDAKSIFWSLAIVSFASFAFLTNMHERYLYPVFPALTILAVWEARLMPLYWAVSGISLLNLYNFWWYPKFDVLVNFLSFKDRLMPRVLGVANFGLFAYFYAKFLRLLKAPRL